MKPSEIREVLVREGIQLTRSLGQSFLHDANQLKRIADAAELTKSDSVLEVGPGLGPLTAHLVDRAGQVVAIEMDARLVSVLQRKYSATPNFTLIHADALVYLRQAQRDWSDWKLVANLPYSIASPLLVDLAQPPRAPRLCVVTLQMEVAKRLMAKPSHPDYGLLTLLIQAHYETGPWFKIAPGCFFPRPSIDSACLTLRRRAQPLLEERLAQPFLQWVKLAFSQRRKMMLKLLKQRRPEAELLDIFARVKLDRQIRAEAVSLTQFVELTRLLENKK